jgi:hypothetical protein
METFLKGINRFLDGVARVQKKSGSEAFKYLQISLSQFEDDLLAIKAQLNQLSVVSTKL